jgi:hypothetical protein
MNSLADADKTKPILPRLPAPACRRQGPQMREFRPAERAFQSLTKPGPGHYNIFTIRSNYS